MRSLGCGRGQCPSLSPRAHGHDDDINVAGVDGADHETTGEGPSLRCALNLMALFRWVGLFCTMWVRGLFCDSC